MADDPLPANIVAEVRRCLAEGLSADMLANFLRLMLAVEQDRRFGQPHHGHADDV